jgi:mannose-6-phosphate isomerase
MSTDADILAPAIRSVARLTDWFRESALPLWLDRGFDERAGGFHERLDFEANPIPDVPRRLTVQGRQIFTYARATMLGWADGRDKVERAFEAMVERYLAPDGDPGFVFTIDDDGEVVDGRRDLYAHAFILLASSAYYSMTGDSQAIALADNTLAFLDAEMRCPHGGYLDSAPSPPPRLRQNPHMHLFEALLALYAATGKAGYLARAGEIFGYFRTRFFQPETGILAEFFDPAWMPLDGPRAIWEPGHHLEWSWLLAEYQAATGVPTRGFADALLSTAYAHGISTGCRIVEEMRGDGTVARAGCRAWPLTEAIKAHAVRLAGGGRERTRLIAACDGLIDRHLSDCLPGLWRDQFTEDGRLVPDYVPASTLYHIAMAVFVGDDIIGA